MINIAGSVRRSYIFPAKLADAYAFYSDLGNTFNHLPHITVAKIHDNGGYRMRYETVELGAYNIRIYADIQPEFDHQAHRLHIRPLPGIDPVKPKARMNSSATQGYFSISSSFTAAGPHTRIEYTINLQAELPPPMGLRFMPRSVVDRIANGITNRRMGEVVEGFIENSIEAFLY